ncbi:MAG: protein-L-isoaspartate(D-aspartate) O-methyltransferase [Proteobacteria bacterium]|nr:protein-L-isoaspartate(D-aspartate) O-methyltransferase [Pseudomonadota bacterium]MBU4581401.1 protein-L-isoaspartate(D-aspartate) O-methyltransferase [Pseudomonadota bacterium]
MTVFLTVRRPGQGERFGDSRCLKNRRFDGRIVPTVFCGAVPVRFLSAGPRFLSRRAHAFHGRRDDQDGNVTDRFQKQRMRMVETQIRVRGVSDQRVLKAMEKIPRHLFVDEGLIDQAYNDNPLPIERRQTISQPYIVALMSEAMALTGREKVLEIGTGSGYQTAILAELAERVFSIERIAVLATGARRVLDALKDYNVAIRVGDGTYGWREESPFEAIMVTAGAPRIPRILIEQLAVGGRLVVPVGSRNSQALLKLTRMSEDPEDLKQEDLGGCRFVDLIGEHGWGN